MSFKETEGAPSHDGCVGVRVWENVSGKGSGGGREERSEGEGGGRLKEVALLFLQEYLEHTRNMRRSLHFASNACGSLLNEQEHQTTQRLQRQHPAQGDFNDSDMFNASILRPASPVVQHVHLPTRLASHDRPPLSGG